MVQYTYERLQPDYAVKWQQMVVTKTVGARNKAKKIIAGKSRYKAVEQMTGGRIPWFVIGALHIRESDGDFDTWMHNGDPMRDRQGRPVRTVNKTRNRPVNPDCTWEDGAYDALVTCEHLDEIDDWCPEQVAYAAEKFNGFGYRNPKRNIPSPYLWGGTNVQKPGKFVSDDVYETRDESGKPLMDSQIGVMAMLKAVMEMDPEARFVPQAGDPEDPEEPQDDPQSEPEQVPLPPPRSPRAGDGEDQVPSLRKSRTMIGGWLSYVTATVSAIAGFFDRLNNPYTLIAFLAIILVLAIGLWMVMSGRVRAQNVIKHLAEE